MLRAAQVMSYVRAGAFYAGLGSATLVFGPLGLLLAPVPLKFVTRYRIITGWTRFVLWWLKFTCGLDYHVHGLENVPASPVIVLCKHQSTFETLALQLLFVPQAWVLKRELLWIPIYGWGLAALRPIAIRRASAVRSFRHIVREGSKRLAHGVSVVIYPEGTRVAPDQRGRYLPGGAMLAEKSGYPIVPVAHNAGRFWPRRAFVKRPGTVELMIGPVIQPTGLKAAEINRLVEERIESMMRKLDGSLGTQPAYRM